MLTLQDFFLCQKILLLTAVLLVVFCPSYSIPYLHVFIPINSNLFQRLF